MRRRIARICFVQNAYRVVWGGWHFAATNTLAEAIEQAKLQRFTGYRYKSTIESFDHA